MSKRIPIKVARDIAKDHGLDQVILLGWDGETSHVVTYGKSVVDCDQAAQGGDLVKKALGWPAAMNAIPSRVKALQKRLKELEEENAKLR